MPILNLIPSTENVFGGLPRIAKLRKGAPKDQNKPGRDLDHIRAAFDPEYEYLAPVFKKLYTDKPKELKAFLNADTVHEAFDFWNEEWTATTMLRRCDGHQKHVWYNEKNGFYQNAKVLCDAKGGGCGCKAVGRLNIILPEFTMETGVIGYFTIETHSEEDIRTLYARITSIWATFGKLRGVPMTFYRVPRKTSNPEVKPDGTRTGKRRNLTRHMLDLRVDPEYTKQHFLAALTGQRAQIPAPPVSVTPSTQRSIALLSNTGGRIGATGSGHKVDTVTGEVMDQKAPDEPPPASEDTDEIIVPPDWYTEAKRGYLLNRLKEENLFEGKEWSDLLKLLDWHAEDCYAFASGNAMYQKIKPMLEAKKQAAPAVITVTPLTALDANPMSPEELAMAERELAAMQ